MEPMLLPWMLNRKRHSTMELNEMPLVKKSKPSPPKNVKPQFRLISFCQRDLAEKCRLIFAYANVPYENVTIHDLKELLTVISDAGPLDFPMLDWNGKIIHDNDAIGRMLAKMYGLAGMGIFEQAQADAIIGIVRDLGHAVIGYIKGVYGLQDINREKMYKETFEPGVKKYFHMLEKYASQGPRDGFFFSSGVTYADFSVANIVEVIESLHPELLIQYRNIKAITQRVFALPQLQRYLASRSSMSEIMKRTCTVKHNLEIERKWSPEVQKEITFYKPNPDKICIRKPSFVFHHPI
uniref:Glutathione S-transferase n=1 Tax=Panagrolaimus sp. ES5 TaxID=591445 RepID=A0AC34FS56_9BILA